MSKKKPAGAVATAQVTTNAELLAQQLTPPALRRHEQLDVELGRVAQHFGCSREEAIKMYHGYVDSDGTFIEPDPAVLEFLIEHAAEVAAAISAEVAVADLLPAYEGVLPPKFNEDGELIGEDTSDSGALLK